MKREKVTCISCKHYDTWDLECHAGHPYKPGHTERQCKDFELVNSPIFFLIALVIVLILFLIVFVVT